MTEAGSAALAAFVATSEDDPQLRCLGRPTPGMIFYTNLYPLEVEFGEGGSRSRFEARSSRGAYGLHGWWAHPGKKNVSTEGPSTGRWEGETLVVDTRNFSDHPSPYQNGIPSGSQKHVVERYRLTEDGTRLVVEFTLEDPGVPHRFVDT
ncbi:MAG: hypothetical protein CM1200mP36_06900 [Gammaproteobacteria bacterium]|nr:MAG: hypothetical protein CM1200mP36_06900 [Gammaproteobacteria bacterium]